MVYRFVKPISSCSDKNAEGERPSDLLGVIRNSLCSPFDRGRISFSQVLVETLKNKLLLNFKFSNILCQGAKE